MRARLRGVKVRYIAVKNRWKKCHISAIRSVRFFDSDISIYTSVYNQVSIHRYGAISIALFYRDLSRVIRGSTSLAQEGVPFG